MSDRDPLSFLDGDKPAGTEVVASEVNARGTETAASTEAAHTEASHTEASHTEASTSAPAEPGHVPISALLDEREKRQAEKAQREALEKRLADMEAARQPQRQLEPTEQLRAAVYGQNLRSSRRFAEKEHGKDLIQAVHDWAVKRCDEDPHFNQRMRSSEDPYEAAHAAYQRDQVLNTVKPTDLEAFKAWQAAQAQLATQTTTTTQTQQHGRAPAAPRSLVTAPNAGGAGGSNVPIGPGHAFSAAIR
jgi:hypothetical protein